MLSKFIAVRGHIFNASSLLFSKVIVYAAYFAAVPVYVSSHGQASYGVVALFGVLIGYSILLENGLSYAVTLRYTRALARAQEIEANRIVRAAMPMYAMLSLACVLCFLLGADQLSLLIWKKTDYADPLRLAGLAVALLVADALFVSIIQAHNRLVVLNMIRLVVDIVRAAALYVAAYSENSLLPVIWMFLISAILKLALDAGYCLRFLVSKQIFRPLFDVREIVTNLKLAPMTIVISIIWLFVSLYDKTYAARNVPERDFAYYALAADLTSKAHVFFYAILGTTYNAMIRHHAMGKGTGTLLKANGIALLFITIFYYLPIFIFGADIVGYFLGPDFGLQTGPLLKILACCSVIYLAFSCFEANLNAQGRAFAMMWIYLVGLLILVLITPWLFDFFGLAGIGFSLMGMFAAMLVLTGLLTLRLSERSS
mgnify:CR=1 FL=1